MPIVQMCPPELCHRLAVIGFKYKLFPPQKQPDSETLVRKQFKLEIDRILKKNKKLKQKYGILMLNYENTFTLCLENQIFEFHTYESTWNCGRFR